LETITEFRAREALRAHVRNSLVPSQVEATKCGLPPANDELSEADVEEEVRRLEREAALAHATSPETLAWQAEQRLSDARPK
jgi:hypothetical protein